MQSQSPFGNGYLCPPLIISFKSLCEAEWSVTYCHLCFSILFHCCSLECLTGWASLVIKEGGSKILHCGCHYLRQLLVLTVSLSHQKFDPISFKAAKVHWNYKSNNIQDSTSRAQMSIIEESIKWFLGKEKFGLSYCHQVTWECYEVSLGTKLQFWKKW